MISQPLETGLWYCKGGKVGSTVNTHNAGSLVLTKHLSHNQEWESLANTIIRNNCDEQGLSVDEAMLEELLYNKHMYNCITV